MSVAAVAMAAMIAATAALIAATTAAVTAAATAAGRRRCGRGIRKRQHAIRRRPDRARICAGAYEKACTGKRDEGYQERVFDQVLAALLADEPPEPVLHTRLDSVRDIARLDLLAYIGNNQILALVMAESPAKVFLCVPTGCFRSSCCSRCTGG